MKRRTLILLLGAVVLAGGGVWAASQATLSALDEPGRLETWAATRAKRWLISRAARSESPVTPAYEQAAAIGSMRYLGLCSSCHGTDGRSPTDIGRGLYPRAVDLGSPGVQSWSDAELFWIVKHGIRLSGMPGFGSVLSDEEIGALVVHVRTMAPPEENERANRH
jgi:mono/diheme cytochrome c family protein